MNPATPKSDRATDQGIDYRIPAVAEGRRLWEIARDSQVLDCNSSYAYVLWCHDFDTTSIVAECDGVIAGFVTGYRPPRQPDVLMIWQVAVDNEYRGRGIAAMMLIELFHRCSAVGVTSINTTISPDNVASQRLFAAVAARLDLGFENRPLFAAEIFPDAHLPEDLYLLAPKSQPA